MCTLRRQRGGGGGGGRSSGVPARVGARGGGRGGGASAAPDMSGREQEGCTRSVLLGLGGGGRTHLTRSPWKRPKAPAARMVPAAGQWATRAQAVTRASAIRCVPRPEPRWPKRRTGQASLGGGMGRRVRCGPAAAWQPECSRADRVTSPVPTAKCDAAGRSATLGGRRTRSAVLAQPCARNRFCCARCERSFH